MIKITVAIATYNRERFLDGLFASILGQTMDKSLYEVLIIDNNCTDNTEIVAHKFMSEHPEINIRYIKETRQGLSFGRNRGISEAVGEYITFADDDALLESGFLEKASNYLDSHSEVAEVGGPIYLKYIGKIPKWENKYMNSLLGFFHPSDDEYLMTAKNKKYPRGSNMTFRMSAFEKCGNFNTGLGRIGKGLGGGEEKDIAFRIFDAGLRIAYSPDIIVFHLVPEERTTTAFIKRQACGVGTGERYRSKSSGEYPKRLFIELFKWGATIILWFRYMFSFEPVKANTLVRFRWWVTCGLIEKNE